MADRALPLVVVPCGGKKAPTATKAGQMYLGGYHQACRRVASMWTAPGNVLILSARYGLLGLEDVIEPYELRMEQPGSVSVDELRAQAGARGLGSHRDVIVLAGRSYTAAARTVWPDAVCPLAGVPGLGYQLQALEALRRHAAGRVQLRRAAGWRLPGEAVSVAHPTKWANPYRPAARSLAANAAAVHAYRGHLDERRDLASAARRELVGKRLACWCPAWLPCHADVLLDVVAGTAGAGRAAG